MDVKDITAEQMEATLAFIKDESRKIKKQYITSRYKGEHGDFLDGDEMLEMIEERAERKLKKLKK